MEGSYDPKVQWGEETHPLYGLSAAVEAYIVGEMENRHLGTAETEDGKTMKFLVMVQPVISAEHMPESEGLKCPVCGDPDHLHVANYTTDDRELWQDEDGEVCASGQSDVNDEADACPHLFCSACGTPIEVPTWLRWEWR